MGKALIIGCGGVASVAIHKCCQNSEVFEEICIASRTDFLKYLTVLTAFVRYLRKSVLPAVQYPNVTR